MRALRSSVEALLLHLHPRAVPAEALRFSRTLGAGGASLVLVVVAAATGVLLLAGYDPSPERAHAAVARLRALPVVGLVRSAHAWAGDLAIAVAAVHLLRVVFRGAHLPPRHLNWLVGLAVGGVVVGSAYTGRLLPWDQLGFWSIHVSSAVLEYVPSVGDALLRLVRGGADVGPATLSRFFGLHVAALPLALAVLLPVHFWQVRKTGGVVVSGDAAPGARGPLVPVAPGLVLREGVAALVTVAVLLLAAAILDAPLAEEAIAGMSPDPVRAPWFLAGLQELLVHLHPVFGAVALPAIAAALLVALPALGRNERPSGEWFQSRRGRRLALRAALAAGVLAPAAVLVAEVRRARPALLGGVAPWLTAGLLPSALACASVAAIAWLARRRGASRLEATQAAFAFVVVSFLVLTIAPLAFRGPGMKLAVRAAAVAAGGTP